MASTTVSSLTSPTIVMLSGLPGSLAHCEIHRSGSASMIVTAAPLAASSVASSSAVVVFPAPPFGLAKAITGMVMSWVSERLKEKQVKTKKCNRRLTAIKKYLLATRYQWIASSYQITEATGVGRER